MSAFLGKIHFWLFNKIRYAEDIEKKIIEWAMEEKNLSAKEWQVEINNKFGLPVGDEPLDRIIDTSNIHGWLQDKITRVESRQASWITKILSVNEEYKQSLIDIYRVDGEEKGSYARENYNSDSAEEIYRVLNDFLLEGMPCDNVDRRVQSSENEYKWISTRCLHSAYWVTAGGDVKNYYDLREEWIKCFVKSLNEDYKYEVLHEDDKRINSIIKANI